MMNNIYLNGQVIGQASTDATVEVIVNGNIIQTADMKETPQINITVDGPVKKVSSNVGDITVNGDVEQVSAQTGDIECGNVAGDASNQTGDIKCQNVAGDVSTTMGDIKYRK
jgi:hypothetical protein